MYLVKRVRVFSEASTCIFYFCMRALSHFFSFVWYFCPIPFSSCFIYNGGRLYGYQEVSQHVAMGDEEMRTCKACTPFRRSHRRDHATGSTTRVMVMVVCRVHGPSKIKKHTSKQAPLQNKSPNLV